MEGKTYNWIANELKVSKSKISGAKNKDGTGTGKKRVIGIQEKKPIPEIEFLLDQIRVRNIQKNGKWRSPATKVIHDKIKRWINE